MFAWGLIGFIAGVLGRHNLLKRKWQLLVFGMLTGYLYGWILNVWTATGFMYELSWKAYIGLCATSFIPDTVHGVSTVVFLWLLADDWGASCGELSINSEYWRRDAMNLRKSAHPFRVCTFCMRGTWNLAAVFLGAPYTGELSRRRHD